MRMLGSVLVTLALLDGCALVRDTLPTGVDLNTAPARTIERLPGVTPSMARRIVEGRPYRTPEDLVGRDVLTPRELDRIRDHVTVRDLAPSNSVE